MRWYLYWSREGKYWDSTAEGAVRRLSRMTEQRTGMGETGGPVCRRMSGGGRGKLWPLVGGVQAHGRTYGEGRRVDRREPVICYPFCYV